MNLQPKILNLLNQRGYKTPEEIEEFISLRPKKTYDPFLLLNMEEGVDLVLSTIEKGERICIYGDYDSDGITSTTIMLEVLSNLTDNLSYYIPSRFDEGYGLNKEAMEKIKNAGIDLIITVDCGSTSVEEVEYAQELGMKVLVTDHHRVSDKIAPCLVINPTQENCTYPFKFLAGCGVVFKFCQAIANVTGLDKSTYNSTLDLVAVGTVGDIVPLIDENRTMVKYGMNLIRQNKRDSLGALAKAIDIDLQNIKAYNISFGIVPHLNAAGRIKEAKLGVQFFRAKTSEDLDKAVEKLKACNKSRREIQDETFKEAKSVLREGFEKDLFILLKLPQGHEGITGIVAGKIKEEMGKPTIIVTPTDEGNYKGTGRSIGSINLYELLKENEELFIKFGGHKAACGFTIPEENIELLRRRLNEKIKGMLLENPQLLDDCWKEDLNIDIEELNEGFLKQLDLFEPFGASNEKPKIGLEGYINNLAKMGNEGQFIRFNLISSDKESKISCVCFKNVEKNLKSIWDEESPVKIIGYPNKQEWRGKINIQMIVERIVTEG